MDPTHVTQEPGPPAGFPAGALPLPPVEVDLGPVQKCLKEREISGHQAEGVTGPFGSEECTVNIF